VGSASEVSLADQIAAVKRELALRRVVYPKLILRGTMTDEKAEAELLAMEAVLSTLEDAAKAPARLALWRPGEDVWTRGDGARVYSISRSKRGLEDRHRRFDEQTVWRASGPAPSCHALRAMGPAGNLITGLEMLHDPEEPEEVRAALADLIEGQGAGEYRLILVNPETMQRVAQYAFLGGVVDGKRGADFRRVSDGA
jgi:hypothetical protein